VEPTLLDVERLLRKARPRPRPEFVRELERSLFRPRAVRPAAAPRRRRRRRFLVGVSFASALGLLLVVLAVAGVRPLGTAGTTGAAADRHCVIVETWALVRRPRVTVTRDGRIVITTRPDLTLQPRIRCR
jgi:hypothetical protein